MIDSIKQLLQQEAQAVLNIPVTDAYEKAVKLIVEEGKTGNFRYGKSRTDCYEHRHNLLLHRYSIGLPAPQ